MKSTFLQMRRYRETQRVYFQLFPNKYLQEFKEARGFDLKILFELDTSPDRLSWIVAYMDFMAREGEPLSLCPSMYKVGRPPESERDFS